MGYQQFGFLKIFYCNMEHIKVKEVSVKFDDFSPSGYFPP